MKYEPGDVVWVQFKKNIGKARIINTKEGWFWNQYEVVYKIEADRRKFINSEWVKEKQIKSTSDEDDFLTEFLDENS